ncbi:hypothetical protein N781_15055 [Pontibacillus halophilus JSM 076056 = DSM 19796]|uniref:Spore germination protein n=1 Tax=Pontibacillus halophilus JSM 076056 = DSM 19796 TaxID=1385510 RepID=A0A0A5GHP0_9BACI|nr:spore germination protein GerPE [Pontibacillus halophilus]KGX92786.1 hypothetical protein N781_15055 [Pontibacillus halophilus JSM 076056 = DSM 19796]
MEKRLSEVNTVKLSSLIDGSIFEIGDAHELMPKSRVLAIQKEGGVKYSEPYQFESYPVFTEPLPRPTRRLQLEQYHIHHNPIIQVCDIAIKGVSTSSIFQIGSVDDIEAETRVKNTRILIEDEDDEQVAL